MKIILPVALLVIPLSLLARGEFAKWTNKDGRAAELELVEVTGEGDDKTGSFKMRNGRTVTLAKSELADEDAARLDAWEPPPSEAEKAATPSVFDEVLSGNLVMLDGRRLKRHKPESFPKKFYVFYYTASWCGPCQAFTPELVKFYNKEKKKNDNFELVLISSDRTEEAMEEYAKDKKMPWPQLKFSQVRAFRGKFDHGVRGIPAVVACDLEGKIVAQTRDLDQLSKLLK